MLWTFVNFAGEDHTNFQTVVAFLKMLSTLVWKYLYITFISNFMMVKLVSLVFTWQLLFIQASSSEGASKVFELLQGKAFRSIGWSTLFDCLSIYEEKFVQSLQNPGSVLPDFQEGDAKALVAYLDVLKKVI